MKPKRVLFVLVLVVSLVMAACTPTSPSKEISTSRPMMTLDGTGWLLSELNNQAVLPGTQPSLFFEKDSLHGSDGCNQFSGSYTTDGKRITIGEDIASTMMACEEPIMQQASAYITALTQAATYRVTNQELILLDASGKTLVNFTPQNRELSGTSWIVTGYNNGNQAVVSPILGSTLIVDFSSGGKLSGSAGCNNYTAAYEVSEENLRISSIAVTRMTCAEPEGVMEQESWFLKALEMAVTYRMEGDKLEMRTAENALAVTCFRNSVAGDDSSAEVVASPMETPQEVQPTPSDPTEAIIEIRKLLELPELPLEFVETTTMANSPSGSLQVENYRDSEGRVYSVNPETNQVVEIDARAILETISPETPVVSPEEIEARAIKYVKATLPDFDSIQSSLHYEEGGKVDNYFFTWYRDIRPGDFMRPFLQIALHKSGILFAFYNTLNVEE